MKTFDEIKEIIKKHKEELKEKYGVKEIGIFGSFVRGKQGEIAILTYWLNLKSL